MKAENYSLHADKLFRLVVDDSHEAFINPEKIFFPARLRADMNSIALGQRHATRFEILKCVNEHAMNNLQKNRRDDVTMCQM